MHKELTYDELNYLNIDLDFETTADVPDGPVLIGQERAVKAMEFGLSMKEAGYNIYLAGLKCCGKTSYAVDCASVRAKSMPVPPDYCYVYNFDDPKRPLALSFNAGDGKQFASDMDDLSVYIASELMKAFSSEEFENDKAEILKNYQDKRDSSMDDMEAIAAEYDFGVKTTNSGIYFLPVIDGETIGEEQYDALDEKLKTRFSRLSDAVQEKASEIMRKIKGFEKLAKNEISELEYKIGLFTISRQISELQSKYKKYPPALEYLRKVSEDVLSNLADFMDKDDDEEQISSMLPWVSKKSDDNTINKYKVNLLVDNSNLDGAPVIKDFNPTYYNLIGEIEYDNEFGNLVTDFMKIKPGLLHKANGGYLILQASDLLTNDKSWDCLKLALKKGEIEIAPLREHLSSATSTLRPEPLPLDIKIILSGDEYYYDLLRDFDDDFDELFKVLADFDYEMDFNKKSFLETVSFVKNFTMTSGVPPFDKWAVHEVVKYSLRNSGRRDKLSTQFGIIKEILEQAAMYSGGQSAVCREDVIKAVSEKEYRSNMYEEKTASLFSDKYINIDTEGKRVGQINGLTVIDTGNHIFGCPVRITATTFIGTSGIINIEKEAEMSGNIHEKGMQVLSGYFGQTYAQDFPLSLSAKICFEQSYSEIDGDSASCAELLTVLSSLSGIPINQQIAVTGSVNQMGEVQAVGGVTYKIEGFYNICKKRGLTGTQGVVMPSSCVRDLVLKDEVLAAVKNGSFHIYSVENVDEAVKLTMGISAGERLNSGKFEPKSVHALSYKKLRTYYLKSREEQGSRK